MNHRVRGARPINAARALAIPLLATMLLIPALLAVSSTADAQAGITNNCPTTDISVGLYGGSMSAGLVGIGSLDTAPGFCVQVISTSDWALMTVAEFQLFDVLWIGNDSCGGNSANDFATAAATVTTWETAIDPASVMIAGGDYDFHYSGQQANAIAVTHAIVTEVAGAAAPGLVLQAGCYASLGAPWFQTLGGSFTGLSHGTAGDGDPTAADITPHPFNATNGFDETDYRFLSSCHQGMAIAAGSAAAGYNLQPLFNFNGGPCFMLSDVSQPPTGIIGGTVWCDDGTVNGALDAGEELASISVSLLDSVAATVATTATIANGSFQFAPQPLGSYTVVIDVAGLPTTCDQSSVDPDSTLDSMSTVTLTIAANSGLTQDFGYVAGVNPPPTVTPVPSVTSTPTVTPVPTVTHVPTPTPVPMTESLTIDKQVIGFDSIEPFTFRVSPDVADCSLTQKLEIAGSGGQIGAAVAERSSTTGAPCFYTVTEEPLENYVGETTSFVGVAPDGYVRFINTWTGNTVPDEPAEEVTALAYTGPHDALPHLALILGAQGLCFLAITRRLRRTTRSDSQD